MKPNRNVYDMFLELVSRPASTAILVVGVLLFIALTAHYEPQVQRIISTIRQQPATQVQSGQANNQQQGNGNNTQSGYGNSQQNGNMGPLRSDHNQVVNGNNNRTVQENR